MGLAASAASAILVKGEISNLELETQQIQRQKLNLANMSASIEEKALQMPVPTAPSTYDPKFLTTVYSGSVDGNNVVGYMGNDGKMHFSVETENAKTLKAGSKGIGVVEYKQVPTPTKPSNTIQATYQKEVEFYAGKDGSECTPLEYSGKKTGDIPSTKTVQDGVDEKGNPKTREVPLSVDEQKEYQAYYTQSWKLEPAPGTGKASSTDGVFSGSTNYEHYNGGAAIKFTFNDNDGLERTGEAADVDKYSAGYSASARQSLINEGYYTSDKHDAQKLSQSDFDDFGKLKEGITLFEKQEPELIGGKEAMTVDEASKIEDAAEIVERIKTYVNNENDGQGGDYSDWRIVKTDSGYQAFKIETGEDGKATATRYDNFSSKAYVEDEGATADVNAAGVGSVTLSSGQSTTLTESQKLDTVKYGKAEAEYRRDKAEYDRVQEEFNQETKKLQRIDKQFDLKLERLANERAALEKQLDDLDKVKEDNTEKSFSAFS